MELFWSQDSQKAIVLKNCIVRPTIFVLREDAKPKRVIESPHKREKSLELHGVTVLTTSPQEKK
jgi:hypothetical protein